MNIHRDDCRIINSETCSTLTSIFIAVASMFLITLLLTFVPVFTAPSYADELSDTKAELEQQISKLDEIVAQMEEIQAKADELQAGIDEKATAAQELESSINEKRERIGELTVFFYKNPSSSLIDYLLSSDNLGQMITRVEFLYDYTDSIAQAAAEQQAMEDQLNDDIAELSASKDEQVALMEAMQPSRDELQAIVDELENEKDKLEAEQRAKLAAASGSAATFATDLSNGEWHTCTASAYGGWSDPGTGTTTATGAKVTETSMGVAIPMRWSGYRSLLGKKIEISYNGKSVIATINDCGGMSGGGPGGERGLDLQPGVFKAFGFNSCNAWGLRAVQYRIL